VWYLVERGILGIERDEGIGNEGGVEVHHFEYDGVNLEAKMEVVEE